MTLRTMFHAQVLRRRLYGVKYDPPIQCEGLTNYRTGKPLSAKVFYKKRISTWGINVVRFGRRFYGLNYRDMRFVVQDMIRDHGGPWPVNPTPAEDLALMHLTHDAIEKYGIREKEKRKLRPKKPPNPAKAMQRKIEDEVNRTLNRRKCPLCGTKLPCEEHHVPVCVATPDGMRPKDHAESLA